MSVASLTPDVCTVSGKSVTLVAGGTCSLEATQAGNSTYSMVIPVIRNFTVIATPQTITFTAPSNTVLSAGTVSLSATASSKLPVTFTSLTTSVCTVSGTTVTLITTGPCSIKASQAGNSTYAPASPITHTFQVVQATQAITFTTPNNRPLGSPPFMLHATSTSGLTVSFTSLTTSVCTASDSTVTLVAKGQCAIQATQAGNTYYAPANPVTHSFLVQ